MPKLWDDTIDAHRQAVRDAILDTVAKLVTEQGLASVHMSQIAEQAGIGRATLYKYFSNVDEMLVAWHERQVGHHLEQLRDVSDQAGHSAEARLRAVLHAYAMISHEHHGGQLAAALHRREHVAHAHAQLLELIKSLISEGALQGVLRDDIAPVELATFCVHALSAAVALPSKAAVRRLVEVTVAGMRASK
jgi:AcrR family transcriptional regulator